VPGALGTGGFVPLASRRGARVLHLSAAQPAWVFGKLVGRTGASFLVGPHASALTRHLSGAQPSPFR
jgi:hypothetical protein